MPGNTGLLSDLLPYGVKCLSLSSPENEKLLTQRIEIIGKYIDLAAKLLVIIGAVVVWWCAMSLPGHVALGGFDFASFAAVLAVAAVALTVLSIVGFGLPGYMYRTLIGKLKYDQAADSWNLIAPFKNKNPERLLFIGLATVSMCALLYYNWRPTTSLWPIAAALALPVLGSIVMQMQQCRPWPKWSSNRSRNFSLIIAIVLAPASASLMWVAPFLISVHFATATLADADKSTAAPPWLPLFLWILSSAACNFATSSYSLKGLLRVAALFSVIFILFAGATVVNDSLRLLGLVNLETTLTVKRTSKDDFDDLRKSCSAIRPVNRYEYHVRIVNGLGKSYILRCAAGGSPVSVPKAIFIGKRADTLKLR